MIDWKAKLSSRKFWVTVAAVIVSVIILLGGNDSIASQVSGTLLALGASVAYILGESKIDTERALLERDREALELMTGASADKTPKFTIIKKGDDENGD